MFVNYVENRGYDDTLAENLKNKLNIPLDFARILTIRNIKSAEEAYNFLNPSIKNMRNPFEIFGMIDAKIRIEKAIENQESVLIYGDYDCDGICAIAILYLYLQKYLKKLNYYVPNRHEEGYGLHNNTIDSIIEDINPDLIITVDCGITSSSQVNYIKSLGKDIIVTDHHEPHDDLPNCIIVNPKVHKQGFYDYCGAGVALKLVEALSNRDEALKYVDIAALATVADIVPLVDENRIIAKFGLDKINKNESFATNLMMQQLKTESITTYDIMFKVAPRFNAVGRMGDATSVVNAFISEDLSTVLDILTKAEKDNLNRQKLCENTVNDILLKIESYNLRDNRIIIMYDKSWDTGILGIAAARISELFYRPVILLNENNGILRGSARSVHSINIFEALCKFSCYLDEFGGHSAAAGITMKIENFEMFLKDINGYLFEKYEIGQFFPKLKYDLMLTNENCTFEFMELIEKVEPFGFGNPKPIFLYKNFSRRFYQIGKTDHIKFKWTYFELLGFNLYPFIDTLNSIVDITFSMSTKTYMGRKYIQGIVCDSVMVKPLNINENKVLASFKKQEDLPELKIIRPIKQYNFDIVKNNYAFGNLYVAFAIDTYYTFVNEQKLNGSNMFYNIFRSATINPYNRVILMPEDDFNFSYYNNIILLDKPLSDNYLGWLQHKTTADIYLAYD